MIRAKYMRVGLGLAVLVVVGTTHAALPPGFQRTVVTSALSEPTTIEFTPDGRLLVGERGGRILVIQNGVLLSTPLIQVSVNTQDGERGLVGLAVDPGFASNGFLYAYYTTNEPRNRVGRFRVVGNTASPTTEVMIWQNPALAAPYHHGGAIRFGGDGNLYIATGDQFDSATAQSLGNQHGKLLRVRPDGSIPPDNPFVGVAGAQAPIWAYGLRNPFRFAVDGPTGAIWIGNVGGNSDNSWEEINRGVAGANYGWPSQEGPSCFIGSCAGFTFPVFSYQHNDPIYFAGTPQGSITMGPVYRGMQFPAEYRGSLFFADYANNWIRRLRFDANGMVLGDAVFDSSPGAGTIVDLREGPDGALYTVTIGITWSGGSDLAAVRRIAFDASGNQPPVAAAGGAPRQGPSPLAVSFSSAGSNDPDGFPGPLTFRWDFGDGFTSTLASPAHTYTAPGQYTAQLEVNDGIATTAATPITITAGTPPVATITQPAPGTTYRAGDVVPFAGSATDAEDGTLGTGALRWQVVLRHVDHVHPFFGPVTGIANGMVAIPSSGHGPENTLYEIELTATDGDGLTHRATRSIMPVTSTLTLDTTPPDFPLFLDGEAVMTPRLYQSLSRFQHALEAPPTYLLGSTPYVFERWADGGPRMRTIVMPDGGTTAEAIYAAASPLASTRVVRFFGTGGATDVDRITVPLDPPVPADVGAGDFTIEFWMRGTQTANATPTAGFRPAGQQELFDDDWINGNIVVDRDLFGATPAWGVSIHRDAGRAVLRFGTEDATTLHTLQGATEVLDGAWHHVAFVRERSTGRKRIVVDGLLDAESAAGVSTGDLSYPNGRATSFPQSDPFLVFAAEKHGFPGASAFPSFAGWLDEIRVWSVARSIDEIAATRELALSPTTPGLVLRLPLEEGVGQSLTDTTGGDTATLLRGLAGNGEWSVDVPTSPPTTSTTQPPSGTTSTSVIATSTSTSIASTSSTLAPTSSTVITSTTSTTLPASGDLVAAYGFEEGAGTSVVDASGRGNAGTLGGPTRTTSGRFGSALAFDGVNDWITVNDASSLDLTLGMTIEAWVYPTTAPSGWRTIVGKDGQGGQGGNRYYLHASSSVASRPATGVNVGAEQILYGTATLPVNTWTHLAATYDRQQQRLFVNGVQVASRAQTGDITISTGPLRIGGNGDWGEYFAGRIDEVRIYDRALAGADIQGDMNRPVVGATSTTTSSTSSSSTSVPTTSSSSTSATTTSSSSTTSSSATTSSSSTTTSSTTTSTTSITTTSASSTTSTSATSTTSTTAQSGLVAAYGFNAGSGSSAVDSSGRGNTGTISGATWTPSGRFGATLTFDGVNDWVTIPDAAALDLTTALTVEAWVYPSVAPASWRCLVAKEAPGTPVYFLHAGSSPQNLPAAGVFVAGAERLLQGGSRLAANAWTHLAATYDGQQQRLYLNGVQVASRVQTGAIATSTGVLRIGGNANWGEYFAGRIDEVRIYDQVRTPAQIQSDMNAPVGP